MLTLVLRLVVTTWLFVSAFVLPHSTVTAWNALIVASLAAAAAFLAFAMPGRPGLRWWQAVLAGWLVASAMILPHVALWTALHDVGVALVMAALSFAPTAAWLSGWHEAHATPAR